MGGVPEFPCDEEVLAIDDALAEDGPQCITDLPAGRQTGIEMSQQIQVPQ